MRSQRQEASKSVNSGVNKELNVPLSLNPQAQSPNRNRNARHRESISWKCELSCLRSNTCCPAQEALLITL